MVNLIFGVRNRCDVDVNVLGIKSPISRRIGTSKMYKQKHFAFHVDDSWNVSLAECVLKPWANATIAIPPSITFLAFTRNQAANLRAECLQLLSRLKSKTVVHLEGSRTF